MSHNNSSGGENEDAGDSQPRQIELTEYQLEAKGYTLQEAYKKIGGMGRFHLFSSAMLIMGFMSGSFLGQQMQFVEYAPQYICSKTQDFANQFQCFSDANKHTGDTNWCEADRNGTKLFHKINETDDLSLQNWIEDLDLACSRQGFTGPIALLGSLQFVGWAISAVITPRLADIYGRKIIFLVSMAIQLVSLILILISRNWVFTAVLMFIFGTGGVGRSSISYLYMQEFLPSNRQTLVGTILQLNNGFVAVYTVIYYWFISKNWIYINAFGAVLTVVSAVGVWFLPESPKFYLSRKRYDEARAAISHIAKVNDQKEFTSKFDHEVIEEQIRDKTLNSSKIITSYGQAQRLNIDENATTDEDNQRTPLVGQKKAEIAEHHLTGSLKDLVRIRRHLVNLIILIFLWVAASFNLYMIGFYMKYVSKSLFVSTLTACLGDIPLSIGGGFTYHHLGPRKSMPIFLAVAILGAVSLATWATPESNLPTAVISIIVLFTRSGIKCTFDSCYLANSTIFPAIFAGTAFGFCNLGAKVVTIFSAPMAEVQRPVPMIIFACLSGVALVAALMIQEPQKEKKVQNTNKK